MEDLRSWWEVPSIAHFCSLFRNAFDLTDFDIEDLEEAFLESEKETGSDFITELLCKLLNGCYSRKDVNPDNVNLYVKDVIKYKWADTPDSPVHQKETFSSLSLREKVNLIYSVCEYRLDAEDVVELLKGFDGDNMRVEPLGKDKEGGTYWYFYGSRLYKEDPPPKKELTREEKKALDKKKRKEAQKKKNEEKQRKKQEKKKMKALSRNQKKKALAEKLKKREEEKASANIRRSGRIKLRQIEEAEQSSESSDSSDSSSSEESEDSSTEEEEEEEESEAEEVEVKRGGRRKSGAAQQERTPSKKGKQLQNKAGSKSTFKKQPPARSQRGQRGGATTPRNQKTAEVSAAQSDPGIRRSSRILKKHDKPPPPPKFDSDTEEEYMDEDNDSGHESAESDDDKSVKSEISKYSATSSVVKSSDGDQRRKVPMAKISLSKEFAKVAAEEEGEKDEEEEEGEEKKKEEAETEDKDKDSQVKEGDKDKDEDVINIDDPETNTESTEPTEESPENGTTEPAAEESQQNKEEEQEDCDIQEVKCEADSKPAEEEVTKCEDYTEIKTETNGDDIPEKSDCKQIEEDSEVKTEAKPDSPAPQDDNVKDEIIAENSNAGSIKPDTSEDKVNDENNEDSIKPDTDADEAKADSKEEGKDAKDEEKPVIEDEDNKSAVPVVKKPAVPPPKSATPTRWHLVCTSLDDWTNLAEWFKESTARCEKSLSKLITEDFLPVLPEIIEAREKEKLRRLKELEIRRSQRITYKQREKMETEKILAEALVAEERAKVQAEEERRIREEQQRLEDENRLREERARSREGAGQGPGGGGTEEQQRLEDENRLREERACAREDRSKRLLLREERARLIAEGKEIPQELIYTGTQKYKDDEDSDDSRCDLKEDEDYQNLMKVIGAMKIHKDCWPFMEAVTDEVAPGYSDVIKRPMDMSKIELKVKRKEYRSSSHFLSDFRLMFNNCKRFNGQDSEFTECARSMERMLKKYAKRFMTDEEPEDSYYDDKDFKAGAAARRGAGDSGEKRYRPRRAAGTRALQTVKKALDGEDDEDSEEEEAPIRKKARGFPPKTLDSQSLLLSEMIEMRRVRERNLAATALNNHRVVTRGPKHVTVPNAMGGVTIFSKDDLPPTGVLKMAATREIKRKVDPQLFGQRADMVKRDPSLNIIDSRKPGSKPPKTIRIVAASQTLSGSASVKETAESVKVSSDGYLIIGGKNSGIKVSENTKIVIQPPGTQPGGPGSNSPTVQAMTKEILIKKIPTSSGDTAEISQARPVANPAYVSNSGAVTPQSSSATPGQVSSTTQGQPTPQRQGQVTLGPSQGQAATGYQGQVTPGSQGQVYPGYQGPGTQGQVAPGFQGQVAPGSQGQVTPQRQGQVTLGSQGQVTPGGSQGQVTPGGHQGQVTPGGYQGQVTPGVSQRQAPPGNAPAVEQIINKALAASGVRVQNQNAPSTDFQKKQIDIAQRIVMLNEQKRKMMQQQQQMQQNGSQPQAGSHFVESAPGASPKVMRLDPSVSPGQRGVQGQGYQTIEDRLRDPAIENQLGNVAKEVVSSVNIAGDILDSYYSVMNKGSKEEQPVNANLPSVVQSPAASGYVGGDVVNRVSREESPMKATLLSATHTTVGYVSPSVSNSLRHKLLSHQPGSGDTTTQHQHSNMMANGPVSVPQIVPRTVTVASQPQTIPGTLPPGQVLARAAQPGSFNPVRGVTPAGVGVPAANVTISVRPTVPTAAPVRYSNPPPAVVPTQAAPGYQQRIHLPTTSSLATAGNIGSHIKNVSTVYNQAGQVSIQTVLNSTRNMTGGKVQVNYPDLQQQPASSIALPNFTLPPQNIAAVNPASLPGQTVSHTPNVPALNPGMVQQIRTDNNSFSPIEALFASNTNNNAQQPLTMPVHPQNTSIVQTAVPSASVNIGNSPPKSDRTNLFDMFGTSRSAQQATAQANYSNNAAQGNLVSYSSGLTSLVNPATYSSGLANANANPVTYPSGLTSPTTYPIKFANPVSIPSGAQVAGQADQPIEIDLESDSSQNDVQLVGVTNPPQSVAAGAGNFAGSSALEARSIMDVLKAQLAQNRAAQPQEQQPSSVAQPTQQSLPQTDLTVAFNTVELDDTPSHPCTVTDPPLDAATDITDDYTDMADDYTDMADDYTDMADDYTDMADDYTDIKHNIVTSTACTNPDINLLQYECASYREDFTESQPEGNLDNCHVTLVHDGLGILDQPGIALGTFTEQAQSFMDTSESDVGSAFTGTIQIDDSNVDWVITEVVEDPDDDFDTEDVNISHNSLDVCSDSSSISSHEFDSDSEADMERAGDAESYVISSAVPEMVTEQRLADVMMSALEQALEDEGGEEDKAIDALDEEFEEEDSRSDIVEEGPSRQYEISSGLDHDECFDDESGYAEIGSHTQQYVCNDTSNVIELPTQIPDDYTMLTETSQPASMLEFSYDCNVQIQKYSSQECKPEIRYSYNRRKACNEGLVNDPIRRQIEIANVFTCGQESKEGLVDLSETRPIEIANVYRPEKEGLALDEIKRRQRETANGSTGSTTRPEESQNFQVFDSWAELQSLAKAKEGEPAKGATNEDDKIYFKLSDSVLKSSVSSVIRCKKKYVRRGKARNPRGSIPATNNTAIANQTMLSADNGSFYHIPDIKMKEMATWGLLTDKNVITEQQEYQIGQSGGIPQGLQTDKNIIIGQQEYQIGQSGGIPHSVQSGILVNQMESGILVNQMEETSRQQNNFCEQFYYLPSADPLPYFPAASQVRGSRRSRGRGRSGRSRGRSRGRGRGRRSKSLSDISILQVAKKHHAGGYTEYCVRKTDDTHEHVHIVPTRDADQPAENFLHTAGDYVCPNMQDSNFTSGDREEEQTSRMNYEAARNQGQIGHQQNVDGLFDLGSLPLDQKVKRMATRPAFKLPTIAKSSSSAVNHDGVDSIEDTGVRTYRIRATWSEESVEERKPHLEPLDPCMVPPVVRTEEVTMSSQVTNPDEFREELDTSLTCDANFFTQQINQCQLPSSLDDSGEVCDGNGGYRVADQDFQQITDDILDLHEAYLALGDKRTQEHRVGSGSVMSGRKLFSTVGRGVGRQYSQDCYTVTADWAGHKAQ